MAEDVLRFHDPDGSPFTFQLEGEKLIRSVGGQDATVIKHLMWTADSAHNGDRGLMFDQAGCGCVVPREDLQKLQVLCVKAGVNNNFSDLRPSMDQVDADAQEQASYITWNEMRGFAREVVMLEQKKHRMRWCAVFAVCAFFGTVLVLGGMAWVISAMGEYEVRNDNGRLALVKKDSNQILSTVQSMEDRDGSDLVDYDRSVDGEDGAWVVPSKNLELVRTISWWEDNRMHVQHVTSIARHGGAKPRVEIATKAGHEMMIYDSDDKDAFNVMLRRWDDANRRFGPWVEVNADGESDEMGRGRVVVSLRRPRLDPTRDIKLEEYF